MLSRYSLPLKRHRMILLLSLSSLGPNPTIDLFSINDDLSLSERRTHFIATALFDRFRKIFDSFIQSTKI